MNLKKIRAIKDIKSKGILLVRAGNTADMLPDVAEGYVNLGEAEYVTDKKPISFAELIKKETQKEHINGNVNNS